jgi:hypothetical protein
MFTGLGAGLAACGGSSTSGHDNMHGMSQGTSASPSATNDMADMPGMGSANDGLATSASGFSLVPKDAKLSTGGPASLSFQILGADNKPVIVFEPDQTKLMHFYLIRSDLSGFQHVHPTMSNDGTWTAPLAAVKPGTYQAYASFIAKDHTGKATPLVLSNAVTVPGTAATTAPPKPSRTTTVDGYTLTLTGEPMAGTASILTAKVTKNGRPVTDLQPYLETYAHVTAIHEGDLAFAHLHPEGTAKGDGGGPDLTFHAELSKKGNYRLFLQFQTGGVLHTAAITVAAG